MMLDTRRFKEHLEIRSRGVSGCDFLPGLRSAAAAGWRKTTDAWAGVPGRMMVS